MTSVQVNTNSFSYIQLQLIVLIARHISCRRATQNTNRLANNLIRPPPSSQHQERLLEELRLQTSAQRPPPKQLQAHLNDLMSIYRLPAHHALIHNSPYQYHFARSFKAFLMSFRYPRTLLKSQRIAIMLAVTLSGSIQKKGSGIQQGGQGHGGERQRRDRVNKTRQVSSQARERD